MNLGFRNLSYTWHYKFDHAETSGSFYFPYPLPPQLTQTEISIYLVLPCPASCFSQFLFLIIHQSLIFKDVVFMRGVVAIAKNRFKQMYPVNGSQGILATITPKKQESNESGVATKEMIDPIVSFSGPPPFPPVIGSLLALSVLETWWNSVSDDDGS
ncbi:hypothetical protein OROGR_028420 [Orobanche gracilis]